MVCLISITKGDRVGFRLQSWGDLKPWRTGPSCSTEQLVRMARWKTRISWKFAGLGSSKTAASFFRIGSETSRWRKWWAGRAGTMRWPPWRANLLPSTHRCWPRRIQGFSGPASDIPLWRHGLRRYAKGVRKAGSCAGRCKQRQGRWTWSFLGKNARRWRWLL